MRPTYPLYLHRLQTGEAESFTEELEPSFLSVEEPDLQFVGTVRVQGTAAVVEDHLVLLFTVVEAKAMMPCRVCNEETEVVVHLENLSCTEEVVKHANGIFDCGPLLRELILVELPQFVECHQGSCPGRQTLKQYLKP